MKHCTVFKLGEIPYDEALSFQFELAERVRDKKGKETFLMLLEHSPVITVGKNGNQRNILIPDETLKRQGIEIRKIDRGGDVTYHGPGQLVGYPILSIAYHKKSIREYVRALEECLINTLACFGVKAELDPKYVGVWVNKAKIGFIGIRISKGITYHGFALNVNPDLNHFTYIKSCGIADRKITSLEQVAGKKISVADVSREFIKCYNSLFNLRSIVVKTHLSYIPQTLGA